VLDNVHAIEQAGGKPVPYQVAPHRAGDIAALCRPVFALALIGWCAERDLAAMCADARRWQSWNPNGYQD
jgi:UDP-glucose 4-epimerase